MCFRETPLCLLLSEGSESRIELSNLPLGWAGCVPTLMYCIMCLCVPTILCCLLYLCVPSVLYCPFCVMFYNCDVLQSCSKVVFQCCPQKPSNRHSPHLVPDKQGTVTSQTLQTSHFKPIEGKEKL